MRSVGKQLFICCGKGSNPGEVENMSKELPTETSPRPRECDCTWAEGPCPLIWQWKRGHDGENVGRGIWGDEAAVGTLGHLLCVTSSWEKQLGREPALGGCFYSSVSHMGLSCRVGGITHFWRDAVDSLPPCLLTCSLIPFSHPRPKCWTINSTRVGGIPVFITPGSAL